MPSAAELAMIADAEARERLEGLGEFGGDDDHRSRPKEALFAFLGWAANVVRSGHSVELDRESETLPSLSRRQSRAV